MAKARNKAGGPRRGRFKMKKLGKGLITLQRRFREHLDARQARRLGLKVAAAQSSGEGASGEGASGEGASGEGASGEGASGEGAGAAKPQEK